MNKSYTKKLLFDMFKLYSICFKKITSCRHIKKQILYSYRSTHSTSTLVLFFYIRTFYGNDFKAVILTEGNQIGVVEYDDEEEF